jgi:hypothetical protein
MNIQVKEVSLKYDIPLTTLYMRIRRHKVQIQKVRKNNKFISVISKKDLPVLIKENDYSGNFIRMETIYYIYPSKLNYLEL